VVRRQNSWLDQIGKRVYGMLRWYKKKHDLDFSISSHRSSIHTADLIITLSHNPLQLQVVVVLIPPLDEKALCKGQANVQKG